MLQGFSRGFFAWFLYARAPRLHPPQVRCKNARRMSVFNADLLRFPLLNGRAGHPLSLFRVFVEEIPPFLVQTSHPF
jgi:hypothetical protein